SVVSNRLEHEESRLPVGSLFRAQQAVLEQDLNGVEIGITHPFGRIEAEAAGKDARARKEALLTRVQEIEAPIERGAHRLLPLGAVARPATKEVEPLAEAREQGLRRQQLDPCGGKLDRERQAVQPHAELCDRRGV